MPGDPRAEDQFFFWRDNLNLALEGESSDRQKFILLSNSLTPEVYKAIREAISTAKFETCMAALEGLYVRPSDYVQARGDLYSRKQVNETEDVDRYLTALHAISHQCKFKAFATAEEYRLDQVLSAFQLGLGAEETRYKLRQEKDLTLDNAVAIARSVERDRAAARRHEPLMAIGLEPEPLA